jgi:hypothetical protein
MSSSTPDAGAAGYLWTNAHMLAVEVAVSREAAASLLPAALRPSDPPTATLFVADYPETAFGSVYREAAVLLHAVDSEGPGVEILRLEATLGGAETNSDPMLARSVVNVIGTPVTGLKLVALGPTEERIRSARTAEAKVALASTDRDPLAELAAPPSASGRYVVFDFGREGGGPTPRILGDVDPE